MNWLQKNQKLIFFLLFVLTLLAVFVLTDFKNKLSLAYMQDNLLAFKQYHVQNPLKSYALFFVAYFLVAVSSLPGTIFMTLLAGALFDVWRGSLITSFASSLGALGSFWMSRFFFKKSVQRRFNKQLEKINQSMKKDGAFYLFSLRLVPLVPFFLLNILMGLSPIKSWTFYWVSQIGMFPATVAYVNAGKQLSQLNSLSGIVSPGFLIALACIATLPFALKYLNAWLGKTYFTK